MLGELLSSGVLALSGFAIVGRNYRTKAGELDIVAIKDGVLWAFEVKTRSAKLHNSLLPGNAVDQKKLSHISGTIRLFRDRNLITLRRLQVRRSKVVVLGVYYGTRFPWIKICVEEIIDITESSAPGLSPILANQKL